MDENKHLQSKLLNFLRIGFESSYMLKYYSTDYNISGFFENLFNAINLFNPLDFTHHQILEFIIDRGLENISKYSVLNTKSSYSFLKETQVLFIAAGPSFGKNIEWIKKNQNNFFIVTIGATVAKLIENNIIPDLIISLDSKQIVLNHFPEHICNSLKDIILLASTMTHKNVLDRFEQNNIFLFETSLQFKSLSSGIIGHSVGEIALNLILILGARDVYTLGNDLALDQDTGSSHFDGYVHKNTVDLSDNKDKKSTFNDTKLNTKGNFRESVITTATYSRSIIAYNQIINQYPNIKIYNLSDGAYLENTIPTNISNVKISIKYKELKIKSYLLKNSTKLLTKIDKDNLQESLNFMENIKNELIVISNLESNNYLEFRKIRVKIFNLLLVDSVKYKSYGLYSIFSKYIILSEQYLYYMFNSNLNKSIEINKIKRIWISHIKNICYIYKSILLKYL